MIECPNCGGGNLAPMQTRRSGQIQYCTDCPTVVFGDGTEAVGVSLKPEGRWDDFCRWCGGSFTDGAYNVDTDDWNASFCSPACILKYSEEWEQARAQAEGVSGWDCPVCERPLVGPNAHHAINCPYYGAF